MTEADGADLALAGEARAMAARLEAVFAAIQQARMADIPILNGKLNVAAVGMRPFDGQWLTALVTPWFINVMLLPETAEQTEAWAQTQTGAKVTHAFPAGNFEFICGVEEGLGPYRMCSLFSPVLEFEDQAAAVATAEAALQALLDPSLHPQMQARASARKTEPEGDDEPNGISRRNLLFGDLGAKEHP